MEKKVAEAEAFRDAKNAEFDDMDVKADETRDKKLARIAEM